MPRARSLVVVPRYHGTLLPAAPAATMTSAVAAGTSGRRANTSAATAAIATENRITLHAAASVEPVAGGAQLTSIVACVPSRSTTYGEGAARRSLGSGVEDGARPRLHRATGDRLHAVAGHEVRLRGIDGRDQDARGRPGTLVERDPSAIRRRGEAQTHEQQRPGQRRPQQQPRREPASPIACAHRPLRDPRRLSHGRSRSAKSRSRCNPGSLPQGCGATSWRTSPVSPSGPRRPRVSRYSSPSASSPIPVMNR